MIAVFLELGLTIACAPIAIGSMYLLVLAAFSSRPRPPAYPLPHLRYDLVVPAHDEEEGIASTIESLRALDYPESLRRLIVVADNCSDATAARAREAGATVIVRDDPARCGKGHALAYAFERLLADGFADAMVIVDADSVASANLLHAFAARLDAGALAVQSRNTVNNPHSSWRTRLMAVAFATVNDLRSLARDRLGCSAGLRGNGMCLSARLLREVPHDVFSVVEDLEYGVRLGLAGHRVRYAGEAEVSSDMVVSAESAGSQRRRWEAGRRQIASRYAFTLLARGIRCRSRVLFELGLDLLVPPLAYIGTLAAAGTMTVGLASWSYGRPLVALWPWTLSLAALAAYTLRGWWLSGTGLRGFIVLAYSPVYLAWKLSLLSREAVAPTGAWVRTKRETWRVGPRC